MSLKNITDELVFEECRHPYIFQVTEGYMSLRLGMFILTLTLASVFLPIWIKYKSLPRLVVRPMPILFLFYTYILFAELGGSLPEAFLDSKNFLNECVSLQFLFHFSTAAGLIFPMCFKLFQYYMRYKLCLAVGKKKDVTLSLSNKRQTEGLSLSTNESNEIHKLHKYTTDSFMWKLSAIAIFSCLVFSSFLTYIYCPQLNDKNLCPHKDKVILDLLAFALTGLSVVGFVAVTIYATINYPDPFGIIREVLVVLTLYLLQVCLFYGVQPFYPYSTNTIYNFTPVFFLSAVLFLQFCYVVPFQIYMASKEQKCTDMNLKTILDTPAAAALFKVHLEAQYSAESIKFYAASQIFRKTVDQGQGALICERFVRPGAPEEINIDYNTRKTITDEVDSENLLSKDLFDKACNEVFENMLLNSYHKFVNGPLFRLYMGLNVDVNEDITID